MFHSLAPLIRSERPVFSMGGSAFPDRAVAAHREAAGQHGGSGAVFVLRSGCYVTHDHGTYEHVSPFPGLEAALTVRAVVLSAPEPGRVVIGAGKRELPYDAGLPVLIGARAPQGEPRSAATGTAAQIFDHHLVLTDAHGLYRPPIRCRFLRAAHAIPGPVTPGSFSHGDARPPGAYRPGGRFRSHGRDASGSSASGRARNTPTAAFSPI